MTAIKPGKHAPYTESQWTAQLEAARIWAREQTKKSGQFFQYQLREDLGVGQMTSARIRRKLEVEGTIVNLGRRSGWAAIGTTQGEVTAERLLDLLEERLDPERAEAGSGRRGDVQGRAVHWLSKSQARDAKTALNLIVERAGDGDPAAVGSRWWAWNEDSDDWEVLAQVREWSDDRARVRAKARNQPFAPRSNSASRAKVVAGARTALDLAATLGLIERGTLHQAEFRIHAAEWQPQIEDWKRVLMEESGRRCSRKAQQGLRTLALVATKRGELSPDAVRWGSLVKHLQDAHGDDKLSDERMRQARWAYNQLRTLGILRGPVWPTCQSNRVSLVKAAAVTKACANRDFSEWATSDGRVASGLSDGPYGLTSWARWATLPSAKALRDHGLPPREWPRPTSRQSNRMHRQPDLFRLAATTLGSRAGEIALIAGWAEQNKGVDWTERTLIDLVNPDLVSAFAEDRTARRPTVTAEGDLGSSVAASTAFALATIASPFLEAQALEAGDTETADRLALYCQDLQALANQCEAEAVKDLWAIESAWRGSSGRSGWQQLGALRNHLIQKAEIESGDRTLSEQVDAIRAGEWTPSFSWAVLIRGAAMISLLRKVPVRVHSLVRLTLDMWESDGEPWEGSIRVSFPKAIMKSNRGFRPYLIHPDHVGDLDREADLRRDLWELYLMKGGARDEVLSVVEYTYSGGGGARVETSREVHKSPFVFPAFARRGGGHGCKFEDRAARGFRYSEGGYSSHLSTLVLRYADDLGMDRNQLERLWGATSCHVSRLLYGTHWANQPGMLKPASIMLQHADTRITERRYCVPDEGRVDLYDDEPAEATLDLAVDGDTDPRYTASNQSPAATSANMEALRRENEEMQELNRKLQEALERERNRRQPDPDQ